MMGFLNGIIDRLFAVVGALVFAQLPLFVQQYEQQLLGRVEELKVQVDALQKMAGNRPLYEYIQKFIASSDSDFAAQGIFLKTIVQRYEDLTQAYVAIDSAAPWMQPLVFMRYFHGDIAASTWHHFDLGLPLTIEGGIYALMGVLVGMGVYRLCRRTLKFQRKSTPTVRN